MDKYILRWKFKNEHEWHQIFDTENDAVHYANICGLYSHPDIVDVRIESITFEDYCNGKA